MSTSHHIGTPPVRPGPAARPGPLVAAAGATPDPRTSAATVSPITPVPAKAGVARLAVVSVPARREVLPRSPRREAADTGAGQSPRPAPALLCDLCASEALFASRRTYAATCSACGWDAICVDAGRVRS